MRQFRISNFGFRIIPAAITIVVPEVGLTTRPLVAEAQQRGRVPQVGFFGNSPALQIRQIEASQQEWGDLD